VSQQRYKRTKRLNAALIAEFWSNVNISEGDGCWTWKFKRKASRHPGRPGFAGMAAARFAWIVANRKNPGRLCVCHTCDNSECVRPSHLFLGTHSENILDMWSKGRAWMQQPDAPRRRQLAKEARTKRTRAYIGGSYAERQQQCRVDSDLTGSDTGTDRDISGVSA
jgi:hypothetical protein